MKESDEIAQQITHCIALNSPLKIKITGEQLYPGEFRKKNLSSGQVINAVYAKTKNYGVYTLHTKSKHHLVTAQYTVVE